MTDIAEKPCIIWVAFTGSLPRKAYNAPVRISISERVESTHEAFEAGAAIAHCHLRNANESSSSDLEKFAALQGGCCPNEWCSWR